VLKDSGVFAPISREGALILNNLFLSVAAGVVLFGTLFPLLADASGSSFSVGAPFYNLVFAVLIVPFFLAVPLGPLMAWKRADLPGALQRLWIGGVVFAAGIAVILTLFYGGRALAALCLGLAAWLVMGALVELADRLKLFRAPLATIWTRAINLPRSGYAMTLAHAGLGFVLAGIIVSTEWRAESIKRMMPGDHVEIAGYDLELAAVTDEKGPNYLADRAEFIVTRGGKEIARLYPERRFYPVQNQKTSETAIRTTGFGDLYVVLSDDEGGKGHAVRIYHNPLAPWMWGGAVLMVIGGLISLTDRRFRVGVASRRARQAPPGAAPNAAE